MIDKRLTKLRNILVGHVARERRTLADVRNLGYDFHSVKSAQSYLKARDSIAHLSEHEIAAVLAAEKSK